MMDLFTWMTTPAGWAAFGALAAMEIVLGIDNVVFISVLTSRLPEDLAKRARQIGLLMAFVMRIALLFSITWIMSLKDPVLTLFGHSLSWRDIVLVVGGLFLIVKATHEIHAEVEGRDEEPGPAANTAAAGQAFMAIIAQIAVIDLVFSLDSIITAIGMAEDIGVMVAAVIVAIAVMYIAADPVGRFIAEHPTTKVLALSFLILIGMALFADGLGFHVPKGYIYSALLFSALVEFVNVTAMRRRKKKKA